MNTHDFGVKLDPSTPYAYVRKYAKIILDSFHLKKKLPFIPEKSTNKNIAETILLLFLILCFKKLPAD